MVYYQSWRLWEISPFTSHISISSSNLWTSLCRFISGISINFLKLATFLNYKIPMGRTFRREKTYGPKTPRLHSHRDLPDYQDDILDDEDLFYNDEEFLDGKLHSEEQDVVGSEDEPTRQRD